MKRILLVLFLSLMLSSFTILSISCLPCSTASADTFQIRPEGTANVRSEPNSEFPKVGTVQPNQKFDILSYSDGWYKIKLNDGNEGWIAESMGKVITSPILDNNKYEDLYGDSLIDYLTELVTLNPERYAEEDGLFIDKVEKRLLYKRMGDVDTYELPEGIEIIGCHAFNCSDKFRRLILPDGVRVIEKWAFEEHQYLHDIVLPSTLEEIGGAAFFMSDLSTLWIPDSVKSLGGALIQETCMWAVRLPEGLEEIPEYMFCDSNIRSVHIPASVKVIGEGAFLNSSIDTFWLPEGLERIEKKAFAYRTNMLLIPSTVTYIGEEAFTEGSKILVYEGSYAELYCKENGYNYSVVKQ